MAPLDGLAGCVQDNARPEVFDEVDLLLPRKLRLVDLVRIVEDPRIVRGGGEVGLAELGVVRDGRQSLGRAEGRSVFSMFLGADRSQIVVVVDAVDLVCFLLETQAF